MVKRIPEVAEQLLEWTRGSLRTDALRAGDDVVATLRWTSAFFPMSTAAAEAQSADGTWTFRESGFFRPKVAVCLAGSESEFAVLRPHWFTGQGTLECTNGRKYRWLGWTFANELGEPVVSFKLPSKGLFGNTLRSAEVRVEPGGMSVPELSLLTLLGWYLVFSECMHNNLSAQ